MVIRKTFRFEGAHIVRDCVSERCKYSIHGHSYQVEVFLTADRLDNGQMILDFGLVKEYIHPFVDSFDHALAYWQADDPQYIEFARQYSARWVSMPVSPSAEMLALMFLKAFDQIMKNIPLNNNEGSVMISCVRVHETASGYAEANREDLKNSNFPQVDLQKLQFSDDIRKDWPRTTWWEEMCSVKL